jgi:hypothetical protein
MLNPPDVKYPRHFPTRSHNDAKKTDVPKFFWTGFIEAHEPSGEVISLVDADLEAHLRWMDESGALANTAIAIISDHGLHMGYWFTLKLEQAVLENKLPVCHLILPRSLLDAVPGTREHLKVGPIAF